MSGDILETIDKALDDYETGPDAMRWAPDPPSPPRPVAYWAPMDGAPIAGWQPIGQILDELAFDFDHGDEVEIRSWGGAATSMTMTINVSLQDETGHWVALVLGDAHNETRCRTCNPHGNPRPSLHGPAYRRRQLARRGRR